MGANSSSRSDLSLLSDDDVNFDHFLILRAIGKGSFGKVCIVQKRDTGRLFAMKYVSRGACDGRGALGGVLKEVELLSSLEHPFLVNLWFSFQAHKRCFYNTHSGITLVPWSRGQMLAWDATCSDTLAPSYIRYSSSQSGSVAENATKNKHDKYKKLLEQNYIILAFAVETLGPWAKEAITFIDKLGKMIFNATGEKNAKKYLKQRISLAIQRSNATRVMDEEDLFMVSDLLPGGDLRYHLQQQVEFSESSVVLLVCELGSALDYLQTQRVVHRDIKPDNILFDERGHAHLTDFNIATRLPRDGLACSMSGTKPYMAPEVFLCALDEIAGYSYPVDWWSLGVVAYEMRTGIRPFIVHSSTPLDVVKNILNVSPHYPRHWSEQFTDLIGKLINVHPGARICSQRELQKTPIMRNINFKNVLLKKCTPAYKPPEDHLNCDPTLELEEMIVETKPLHKKKKRLAKQRSEQKSTDADRNLTKEFIVYNRYKELKKKAMEMKENEWQEELNKLMANSQVNQLSCIDESNNEAGTSSKGNEPIEYIDRTPSPKSAD